MRLSNAAYFFRESLRSSKRNRVMSIASVGTVAAALLILGIFMILIMNVNNIVTVVVDKVEVKVYMKDDITTLQQQELENTLKSYNGVKEVTLETKEQALEKYKKMLGEDGDLANGLEERNPLPASFTIKVTSPDDVKEISQAASGLEGVDKVMDAQDTVTKLISIINVVKWTSIALMIILGVIALFLISNTIKITVYARRKEVSIMKYIGATDWFIKWPFVIEGITLGFWGAVVSLVILGFGYGYVSDIIKESILLFPMVSTKLIMHEMALMFLGVGMLIGGIGSLMSLKKFLVV